ncbi:MAG: transposase, partial [Akkermansia sp.]|nr:transposase [Akkermansia sp.]
HVSNALQYQVNRKYVRRLMKELGLKAIYCKRNTSKPHPKHEKVPYLLWCCATRNTPVLPQKKQSPKSGCLKIAVTEILADN